MDYITRIWQVSDGNGIKMNLSATTTVSSVLPGFTRAVLLWSTTNAWIEVGGSSASNGSGMYLAASQYVQLVCGTSAQISGVRDAADGTLYIKPLVG